MGAEGSQALLEREAELERLEGALAAAGEGSGGLMLLEGRAGIGKTSLLRALCGIAEEREFRVLGARATEIEREFPYGAVRQLLEPALRAAAPARRREWLSEPAHLAGHVLGMPPEGSIAPEPGPGIPNAIYWLLTAIAGDGACVLALDDAHWADADSLRFLAFLSPRLAELPVLAVVAARTEEPEALAGLAGTASDPASRPLVLAPLSAAATESMVAGSFDSRVDPELAQACHESTGGNPFYLRSLIDVLREERVPPTAASAERARTLGPHTVTRVIVTRVARLASPAAQVARALAVLGDGADLEHVAGLADIDPSDARRAVDALASAGILAGDGALGFAHPILGNALRADFGPAERADLHQRAASLLAAAGAPAETIAAHLLAIEPRGDPEAVAALRAAAGVAGARGAFASAVAHLRRALAEPPGEAERGPVLMELGLAEMTVDGTAAVEHLRAALALTEEPGARAALSRTLAQACFAVGDPAAGIAALRAEAGDAGDIEEAGPAAIDLVAALAMGPSSEAVSEADERIERIAPRLTGESESERTALDCLGFCRLRRGVAVADVAGPIRLRLERTPDGEALSPVQVLMSVGTLIRCDELELAEEWALRALGDVTVTGSVYGLAAVQWLLGDIAHRRGALEDAVSNLEASLRGALEYGAQVGVQSALASMIAVRIDRGEPGEALAALAETGLEAGAPDATASSGDLLEARGLLHLAGGDPEAALRDLAAAAEQFSARGEVGPGIATWRLGAARAHLRLGDTDEARRLAAEALERARRFGTARAVGMALQVAAVTEPADTRTEMLEEAVATLAGSPMRLEHARAQVELGGALRRSGERAAAREHLAAGLDTARACGAMPLAERAYEELRAAGARPRKLLRSGADSLTPSEARVARLATTGMTNREIAQELFVTAKTVEFHLGQTYRKLGISSRAELGAALSVDAGDG